MTGPAKQRISPPEVSDLPAPDSGDLCAVCDQPVGEGSWVYHHRLQCFIHGSCPVNSVRGEDLTFHAMLHGGTPKA